ncbi:hypothetical protein CR513_26334, partial [Mucuna pruriens]
MLALTKNEEVTTGAQALPKKCRDPGIFLVPCTIGECTFVNAMLVLGASINDMPTSIYKALNFGDLGPIGMTIQLVNRSILENVLVQVNELIFPADFYMLDMEDETFGQGSTLILGRPFLMIAKTKIDLHAGTFLMEFGDTLVQFNIFEPMKHLTEDHSLFGIDLVEELVEEYFQLDNHSEDINNFVERTDSIDCLGSISEEEADYAESREVHNLSDFVENNNDIADLDFEAKLLEVLDQVCKHENPEYSIKEEVQVVKTKKLLSAQLATIFTAEYESAKGSRDQERTEVILAKKIKVKADRHVQTHAETIPAKEDQKQARAVFISDNKVPSGSAFKAKQRAESNSNLTRTNSIKRSRPQQPKPEIMSAHLVPSSTQVGQSNSKTSHDNSSSPPSPMELKPLRKHLTYAYLDTQQQLPIIIAHNLHQEQEDKLLQALRQYRKGIGWKLDKLISVVLASTK